MSTEHSVVPLSFEVVCSLTLWRFPQRGPIPLVLMALREALTPGDGGAQIKSAAPAGPSLPTAEVRSSSRHTHPDTRAAGGWHRKR